MSVKGAVAFYLCFIGMVLAEVIEENVKFVVYSRENVHGILGLEHYHRNKPITFLIHGFNDSNKESYMLKDLKNALLSRGDITVVCVDWSVYAIDKLRHYPKVARNAIEVGRILGRYIAKSNITLSNTLVIGFSLGAHVAGVAGKHLFPVKLPKIIGLDPAGVLFNTYPSDERLESTDANIVEVIHSSGGGLGFTEAIGTRDFFPNGGQCPQPGCESDPLVCSHRRSYYIYGEALAGGEANFVATKCDSYSNYQKNKCKADGSGYQLRLVNDNHDDKLTDYFENCVSKNAHCKCDL